MLRMMNSGISGLKAHQTRQDVVGNNIANVNTQGYRARSVLFTELVNQKVRGATGPERTGTTQNNPVGGVNPMQVGLGVRVSTIETSLAQGGMDNTGKESDVAIEGKGFFVISDGNVNRYTRVGAFDLSVNNVLISKINGWKVQGWIPDSDDKIDANMPLSDIVIPIGRRMLAKATDSIAITNNLNADAPVGETAVTPIQIYDSIGRSMQINYTFTKSGDNTWDYTITCDDPTITLSGDTGTITFNTSGALDAATGGPLTFTPTGADPMSIATDFATVTQFGSPTNVTARDQNGYPAGILESYSIGDNGLITGSYTNGMVETMAQMAIATFANEGGLENVGSSVWVATDNSGMAELRIAGTSGVGEILAGFLEGSNVDLAQEFTNMIVTQRGYQANSKLITVADEMLNELVNLKR